MKKVRPQQKSVVTAVPRNSEAITSTSASYRSLFARGVRSRRDLQKRRNGRTALINNKKPAPT